MARLSRRQNRTSLYMPRSDIPINAEFLDSLTELQEAKDVRVYHRDPTRKKITQIVMERTLKDFDPAMILFEYMKQENLRLIDLFRVFDTDCSHSVSKTEMKQGFVAINLPLSDEALDGLFERMDLNENNELEYEEYKIGYRKTMNKIRKDELAEDDKNMDTITQLRNLIKKALKESRDLLSPPPREQKQSNMKRASLTAVFKAPGLGQKKH